jgi:signal transduction histidine kinase
MKIPSTPADPVATRIAMIYLLVGVTWIITTDGLLYFFVANSSTISYLQFAKGWAYIFVTALLLYFLVLKYFNQIKQHELQVEEKSRLLEQKNQELDTFIYKSSHDLKGPVSSLDGIIHLLKTQPQNNSTEYLEMLEKIADKMRSIVESLSQMGEMCLQEEAVVIDFNKMFGEIKAGLSHHKNISRVKCTFNIQPQLHFRSRYNVLRLALSKFFANAYDYCTAGNDAVILVAVFKKDDQLVIRIEDNGIGIPQQHIDRIFKMFYMAQDVLPSAGLGLYLAKYAIDILQGKIEVQSQPGKGSCFIISFPYRT